MATVQVSTCYQPVSPSHLRIKMYTIRHLYPYYTIYLRALNLQYILNSRKEARTVEVMTFLKKIKRTRLKSKNTFKTVIPNIWKKRAFPKRVFTCFCILKVLIKKFSVSRCALKKHYIFHF